MGKSKCRTIIFMRPKMERIKTEMYGQLIEHPSCREEGRVKFQKYHELRDSFQHYQRQYKRMKAGLSIEPVPEFRREERHSTSRVGQGWSSKNLQALNQIEQTLKGG